MHIHILGICGTFMGGVAILAKELGFNVTGSDQNVYPPMSSQLEAQGIQLKRGYKASNLDKNLDLVVIGNAISRGNTEVEAVLNRGLPYTSGPGWLSKFVLENHHVLAVAGTHGKTTTSSMLAWIMEDQGLKPGFLIGGVPNDFGLSARLGGSPYFIVEADEYDTAFFDKRSKFVHYRPSTVVLNNLEFDHADIFPDLDAIKMQFHHLIRTIPGNGLIIVPENDNNLADVLDRGCWTSVEHVCINSHRKDVWNANLISTDGSCFDVGHNGDTQGTVTWELCGLHNVYNALSAIAASCHVGICPDQAAKSLCYFKGVKRRMEIRAVVKGITLYDDFAHHPTAIASTLQGLRQKVKSQRIIAILEPRSNTMRMGIHKNSLGDSLKSADFSLIYQPENAQWDIDSLTRSSDRVSVYTSIDKMIERLIVDVRMGDHLVFMSNGAFGNIHQQVENRL